jgi:hypothetical protein
MLPTLEVSLDEDLSKFIYCFHGNVADGTFKEPFVVAGIVRLNARNPHQRAACGTFWPVDFLGRQLGDIA